MPEIYIAGTNYGIEQIVSDALSFIWTERHNGWGDFELVVPYTGANADRWINTKPKFIMFSESDRIMLAEKFEFEQSSDGGTIKISGRSGESLLEYRVLFDPYYLWFGPAHPLVNLIIRELLNPSSPTRRITGMRYLEKSVPPSGSWLPTNSDLGEGLLSIIDKALKPYGAGCHVIHDGPAQLTISYIAGKLQSHVLLSPNTGLSSFRYTYDRTNSITTVYHRGEVLKWVHNGQEVSWTIPDSMQGISGIIPQWSLDTKEGKMEIDQNLRAEIQGIWKNAAYTTDQQRWYAAAMAARRSRQAFLEANQPETIYDIELEPNAAFQYNRDFVMGDQVYIQIPLSETKKIGRCIEHTWSIDSGGSAKTYSAFKIEE